VSSAGDEEVVAVLERARTHGALGPGPVVAHVVHARGFAAAAEVAGRPPSTAVDLGSGGGVPGLVLALHWPASQWLLVDANRRRARDLEAAVETLELRGRVEVRAERAEVVAHEPARRETAELVVARGFAPPPVTAEIAAGLLVTGGRLVVSEPPGGQPGRWPADGLAALGFGPAELRTVPAGTFAVCEKRRPAPPDLPRATRRLVKRPAWPA
jgi:hypothetical protein